MEHATEHCTCCRNFCPIGDLQCRKGKEKTAERLKEMNRVNAEKEQKT
ncbi:hypothetical protein [Lachnoclostridium edouardi]|nr:hypothetical protein [Lachnoclostridium edouardi]